MIFQGSPDPVFPHLDPRMEFYQIYLELNFQLGPLLNSFKDLQSAECCQKEKNEQQQQQKPH